MALKLHEWPAQVQEKIHALDSGRMPRHIAFIMDGNGRWARQRHRRRLMGHREGIKTAKRIIRFCHDIGGIECITLYAFSTENWKRPKVEIAGLMLLLKYFLRRETAEMVENDIRFRVIGRTEEFPAFVQREIHRTMEATASCRSFTLNVALNYGSRREILEAALELHRRISSGAVQEDQVDQAYFSKLLYTADLPEPDLLIRTSGENRISNFLLWQLAYAEFYITSVLWPDFGASELLDAILNFQARERRFGGLGNRMQGESQE